MLSDRKHFILALTGCIALLLSGNGESLRAQGPEYPPPQSSYPPQSTAPDQTPTQILSPDQLDDLVAPIALYPDPLLSQVLVATTYPLEVVEAQQWLQQNRGLQSSQLLDAARQQNWDASVQALVAFPDVLSRLNQDVRWTTDLGNAFLAQQADVMSAVQRMRARAQANGRLQSTAQQSVNREIEGGQPVIQIEPVNPEIVYVPTYDPMYVWGPPAWGYYPSLYYPTYGFGFGPGINIGLYFGGWGGYGWSGWGGWGWRPNWYGRTVFVNNVFFNRYGFRGGYARGFGGGYRGGTTIWAHDPGHRLGIPYPNRQLSGRFGAASMASRANWQRSGGQSFGGRTFGGNSGFQSQRQGGTTFNSGRQSFQGNSNFRGSAPQGRSYGSQGMQSTPRSVAPSQTAPSQGRSFGSGGSRNFRDGSFGSGASPRNDSRGGAQNFNASPRVYGGGGNSGVSPRSYNGGGFSNGGSAPRNFGGNPRGFNGGTAQRSFGGGGNTAPRSFSGGSSAPRSFSGGGNSDPRSFGGGGGGGHNSGNWGGGGHSGGGNGRHR